jgi:tetraacyldisaccharide 4'-kinase
VDEQWYLDVVAGRPGIRAAVTRKILASFEPAYAKEVARRNRSFDRGRGVHRLSRPTVSVGNLTVGGTGKTPVVAWLCRQLLDRRRRPAILTRGYGSTATQPPDEARLLAELLEGCVPVEANPNRRKGAADVVKADAEIDCFVLDDGFQHRRAARDFDLVLIDATRPFGHDRLLPRGLLREPVASLARASAVLITRCDLVDDVEATRATITEATNAPIYTSRFKLDFEEDVARPAVVACGIGNPLAFAAACRAAGADVREELTFGDHHAYDDADVARIAAALPPDGIVLTTGKDWVKLRPLWPKNLPVAVARQSVEIEREADLLKQVSAALATG